MTTYDVTVTYIDNTAETWDYVDEVALIEGVLRLHQKHKGYGASHDRFIGIPLAVVRKWESIR